MLGSSVLDVMIGVVFIYFVLSLLCTHINELIAAICNLRAKTLEQGIFSILNSSELVSEIYKNSIVQSSNRSGKAPCLIGILESSKPSYISSQQIATAFLDIIQAKCQQNETDMQDDIQNIMVNIQSCAQNLPDGDLKNAVYSIARHAQGDCVKFRNDLEDWFDLSMQRVTGWYKKRMQVIGLIVAMIICTAVNADTIELSNRLYKDANSRNAIVNSVTDTANNTLLHEGSISQDAKTINKLSILGWNAPLKESINWFEKILGLFITSIAISLGAPFWFDILNKVVNVRLAGEKPKTAAEMRRSS